MGQSDDADKERIAQLTHELRLRDDFISIAAHELRNPLTPISLDVDILLLQARRRPQPDPAEIASLERLQRNIRIFSRRAATLLDVSRLQAGRFTLDPRRTLLSDVVRCVVAASSAVAAQARCELVVRLDDEASGDWDPAAVEQIVENLLSNALRYGAGKPVTVTVRVRGNTAQLEVSDRGIGIDAADQERIFDRFHRVPGAEVSGFGVGLWISRELARAMTGDVTVRSSPGEGASFILGLPMSSRRDLHAVP